MRVLLLLFLTFFAIANACEEVQIYSRAVGAYLTATSGQAPSLSTTVQTTFCIVGGVIETSDGVLSLQQPITGNPSLIFGVIANGGVAIIQTTIDGGQNWVFSSSGENLQTTSWDISSQVVLASPTGDSRENWQVYPVAGGSSGNTPLITGSGPFLCTSPFYLYSRALGYYVTASSTNGGFAFLTSSPMTIYCMSPVSGAAGVISVGTNANLMMQTNTPSGNQIVFASTTPDIFAYVQLDPYNYFFTSNDMILQTTWYVSEGLLLGASTGDSKEQFQAYDQNLVPMVVALN